jgi:hypothetical protein
LIAQGADVDARVREESALSAACYHNNTELAKLLLDNGAGLDVRDPIHNRTPLQAACYNKNPDLVSLLIKAGTDVNMPDQTGETPLMIAERMNSREIIQLLREAGAE